MTEAEWEQCKDQAEMLRILRGRSGKRKMRLLACDCARSQWSGLVEEEYRRAVDVAERYADGLAERKELRAASEGIWFLRWGSVRGDSNANGATEAAVEDFPAHAALTAIACFSDDAASMVREIFGNPFRSEGRAPGRLRGQGRRSREMAQRIYDDRRFEDLPLLADHLADEGCEDCTLLAHLRSGERHFRGCWALDAVLDREAENDLITEEEWLSETRPVTMLAWWTYFRGEPSPRKRRFLACASCRLIWPLLADDRLRHAVEVSEAFADGLISDADLARAREPALALGLAAGEVLRKTGSDMPEWATLRTSWRVAHAAASAADLDHGLTGNACHFAAEDGKGRDTEDAGLAGVIREILGNPRRQVIVDPTWLRWNKGLVPEIARAIYDRRDFKSMPILADALEDAGCNNEEILSHCREAGLHVRGCWLLDLVLGKG